MWPWPPNIIQTDSIIYKYLSNKGRIVHGTNHPRDALSKGSKIPARTFRDALLRDTSSRHRPVIPPEKLVEYVDGHGEDDGGVVLSRY
jgi:hypothetical protein